ncbi:hypothetical protein [Nocardioides sp.]|uniref:hypothetical protein n=1 Tax=Nocardioides sp. TaxID=35761 RepID=UPI003D0EA5DA
MQPLGPAPSGSHRTWRLFALLLVLAAVASTAGCSFTSDTADDEPTTLTGIVTVGPQERRATVTLTADLTSTSSVAATTVAPEPGAKAPLVRRTKIDAKNDSFTIFLSRAPTKNVPVSWIVKDLKVPSSESSTASDTMWKFITGLVLAFLVFGLVSMALTVGLGRTPAPGTVADRGLVFASYLKVSALIALSAIALIAIVIVAADNPNMSALFTLLGTIAGYLAGTKPRTEEDSPAAPKPDGGTDAQAGRSSRTLL